VVPPCRQRWGWRGQRSTRSRGTTGGALGESSTPLAISGTWESWFGSERTALAVPCCSPGARQQPQVGACVTLDGE
jgi:hypothetical protein